MTHKIISRKGHERVETTQIFIHGDAPPNTTPGRYHPPDSLLAFLAGL